MKDELEFHKQINILISFPFQLRKQNNADVVEKETIQGLNHMTDTLVDLLNTKYVSPSFICLLEAFNFFSFDSIYFSFLFPSHIFLINNFK